MLGKRLLSKDVEKSMTVAITKPGKEHSNDASKYRPISLLNVAGKLLEKLLIDRILHHMYKNKLLNNSQFGFTTQVGTTEAVMEANNIIEKNLNKKQSVVLVSLDIKGAFDAAR